MYLTIGSGDTVKLLSGKQTKGFSELVQKFVADNPPKYNSFASPIDALRTGAILERKYLFSLDNDYYFQHKSECKEFDCLVSSIDFAKMENGEMVDFDELKTIHLTDYIDTIEPLYEMKEKEQLQYIKKLFKVNYNQVQFQLFCSGLKSANLVFLAVHSYIDEENYVRVIKPHESRKFRIKRDPEVIGKIKKRAEFFQMIKTMLNDENI